MIGYSISLSSKDPVSTSSNNSELTMSGLNELKILIFSKIFLPKNFVLF